MKPLPALSTHGVGIDLAGAMLAEAQRRVEHSGLDVTFQVGDAESPLSEGAPYDVIIADLVQGATANLSTSASNSSDKVMEILAFMRAPGSCGRIHILPEYSTHDPIISSRACM